MSARSIRALDTYLPTEERDRGGFTMSDPIELRITSTPPFKSAEDAKEAGNATADLLRIVAELMGQPDPVASMVVKRLCDGCGKHAPSAEMPDDWTQREDDDFCPNCVEDPP
jgi:hypothetical protein